MQQKVKKLPPTQRKLSESDTDAFGKGGLLASSRVLLRAPLFYPYVSIVILQAAESVENQKYFHILPVLALRSVIYVNPGLTTISRTCFYRKPYAGRSYEHSVDRLSTHHTTTSTDSLYHNVRCSRHTWCACI